MSEPSSVLPAGPPRPRRSLAGVAVVVVLVVLVVGIVAGTLAATHHHHRAAAAGAAATPTSSTGGTVTHQPVRVIESGTDYTKTTLLAKMDALLRHPTGAPGPPVSQACLTSLLFDAGSSPLLVDRARYDGRPAIVVALPDPPASVGVYALSPDCSGSVQTVLSFAAGPSPS